MLSGLLSTRPRWKDGFEGWCRPGRNPGASAIW